MINLGIPVAKVAQSARAGKSFRHISSVDMVRTLHMPTFFDKLVKSYKVLDCLQHEEDAKRGINGNNICEECMAAASGGGGNIRTGDERFCTAQRAEK